MGKKDRSTHHVVLPTPLTVRRKKKNRAFGIGVAPAVSSGYTTQHAGPVGLDSTFPPIIPQPVTLTNNGGAIGTADPVQLIFWGSAWNQPATTPSAASIVAAVQTILAGPYLSGLRQYGVKRCPFGGSIVVTLPSPPTTFNDGDVQDLIWALIDDNRFPEPDDPGGRNLYAVFMPPGTTYGPGGARGAHSVATDYDFPFDVDHAWVAWIGNSTLGQITSTFCHELVEMCTDPESDAWTINGQPPGLNEIGDACNLVDQVVNGITFESYWSVFDNACLIPTSWSVRRTLAGAGKKLNGSGLRSIQNPIASLNQWIVNL